MALSLCTHSPFGTLPEDQRLCHGVVLHPIITKLLTLHYSVSIFANISAYGLNRASESLAVTIPFRRHLSFWAKDTLFSNPISCAILTSSGSIPVHRNSRSSSSRVATIPAHKSLFGESSAALAKGTAVGVFPEGTSYTEPRIMQVKDGAARAAMEYSKWTRDEGRSKETQKALVLVPVGIVYTDKSQYRSRVSHTAPSCYFVIN
jgi:hypothetical protein